MTPEERIEADRELANLGLSMSKDAIAGTYAEVTSTQDLGKILEATSRRLLALSDPRMLVDRLTEDQFRVVFSMTFESGYTFGAVQHGIIDAFDRENLEPDYQQFVESCESAERVLTAIWLERLHQRAVKIQSLLDNAELSNSERIELLKKMLATREQAHEQEKHQLEDEKYCLRRDMNKEMEELRQSDQNGRENWDGIIDPLSNYLCTQDDYTAILNALPEDGGPVEMGQSYIQLLENRRLWAEKLETAIVQAANGFSPVESQKDEDVLDYLAELVHERRKLLSAYQETETPND